MHLALLLEMVAQAYPDRVAVTGSGEEVGYQALLERAQTYAAAIPDGASACYLGENSPDAVAWMFGASLAGRPYVPLNYRWTDAQLAEALERISPAVVLTDEASRGRVPSMPGVSLAEPGPGPASHGHPSAEDETTAVLLFTSGTSGTPKAAVLRNRHLVPYVLDTVDFGKAADEEAILVSVPPYHIAAVSSVLTSVYSGRRMVQLAAFDPAQWVEVAAAERITQAMVVPTMLNRILDHVEERTDGLPHLRHLSYGGGRMPAEVVERAMRLLPHTDLVNAYGLTETSSTITLLSPDDHREAVGSEDPAVRARLGSVGRALPSVRIEVRDDQGSSVPHGEAGEVFVQGPQVSGEYLSHSSTDTDGWFPTRDRGHLDRDGFLYLHGRSDDVIVRGGENLSPAEIEDRLTAHPTVSEAAVVGVPDAEWGERVEAFVVAANQGDVAPVALQAWVREALRSAKVPAAIHVVNDLPYNETGKLLRRELRKRAAATTNQGDPRAD